MGVGAPGENTQNPRRLTARNQWREQTRPTPQSPPQRRGQNRRHHTRSAPRCPAGAGDLPGPGLSIPAPHPSFPHPTRHSGASRNPAPPPDSAFLFPHPNRHSRTPPVIPAQAGIQRRLRTPPFPAPNCHSRTPPVIPAQAGIWRRLRTPGFSPKRRPAQPPKTKRYLANGRIFFSVGWAGRPISLAQGGGPKGWALL